MVALDSNKKTVPQQPGHAAATAAVAAAMDARTASAHAARTRRQRHGGGDGQAAVAQGQTDKHANERKHSRAKKADSTLRSSQAVPHPSTNRALRCLTSEVERDPVHSTRYGRRRQKRKIPKQPPSFLPSPILPDPPHRSRHRTELDAEVANSQGRAFRLSCRAGLAGAQTSRQTARHQK